MQTTWRNYRIDADSHRAIATATHKQANLLSARVCLAKESLTDLAARVSDGLPSASREEALDGLVDARRAHHVVDADAQQPAQVRHAVHRFAPAPSIGEQEALDGFAPMEHRLLYRVWQAIEQFELALGIVGQLDVCERQLSERCVRQSRRAPNDVPCST